MKMVKALRITMTKMMTSEGHLQEDDFRWSGTSPAFPGTASARGALAWSGASPRGRQDAARWQKDKIKRKKKLSNLKKRQKRPHEWCPATAENMKSKIKMAIYCQQGSGTLRQQILMMH